MATVVLLTATGLGLGALYFLIASGLTLIFGLMDILNFAHGALLSIGAYATWWAASGHLPGAGASGAGFVLAVLFGTAVGTAAAVLLELAVIRPLYERPREQILATVGVGLAVPALLSAVWGTDPHTFPGPKALSGTFGLLGARIPVDRLVLIVAAVAVLAALKLFFGRTRHGLIVRAGVEDRAMVSALGVDVRKAFTLVFAIGGAAAGLGGALGGLYFGSVDPGQGPRC
jgi:branched-chain amino acid transport system permease protein